MPLTHCKIHKKAQWWAHSRCSVNNWRRRSGRNEKSARYKWAYRYFRHFNYKINTFFLSSIAGENDLFWQWINSSKTWTNWQGLRYLKPNFLCTIIKMIIFTQRICWPNDPEALSEFFNCLQIIAYLSNSQLGYTPFWRQEAYLTCLTLHPQKPSSAPGT